MNPLIVVTLKCWLFEKRKAVDDLEGVHIRFIDLMIFVFWWLARCAFC
jgi:hypothetical protein